MDVIMLWKPAKEKTCSGVSFGIQMQGHWNMTKLGKFP